MVKEKKEKEKKDYQWNNRHLLKELSNLNLLQ